MMNREQIEQFKALSVDEQRAELLDGMKNSIKEWARRIAMLKAIGKTIHGIEPEKFDAEVNKALAKEWDRLKDKSEDEIAIIALGEMVASGADVSLLLDD